jgi:hypothetical protein
MAVLLRDTEEHNAAKEALKHTWRTTTIFLPENNFQKLSYKAGRLYARLKL